MLHGAAPANSRAVRSTAARVEFGCVEELEWAGTSSRAVGAKREWSQAAGTPSFSNQLWPPSTERTTSKELKTEDDVMVYRPPSAGAGPWSKLTSLSPLIGRGSHGSALSGRGLGEAMARPAHSTRMDSSRKSWSVWRSRIGTATAKILSQKNEPPETTGGPWYIVASEPKAASTRGENPIYKSAVTTIMNPRYEGKSKEF
uniref:Integrin beta subunit cytoplasmic domain-containing protein n=1 Tax=Eptatretus burgeri TaxID=7764 RepID=A0A8C4X1H7_EPTBU